MWAAGRQRQIGQQCPHLARGRTGYLFPAKVDPEWTQYSYATARHSLPASCVTISSSSTILYARIGIVNVTVRSLCVFCAMSWYDGRIRQRETAGLADGMVERQQGYRACLLRLWHEGGGESLSWRASLQSPQRDEVRGFASLPDLFAFLEDETRLGSTRPVRVDQE